MLPWNPPHPIVSLREVSASRSEGDTQSKDPFHSSTATVPARNFCERTESHFSVDISNTAEYCPLQSMSGILVGGTDFHTSVGRSFSQLPLKYEWIAPRLVGGASAEIIRIGNPAQPDGPICSSRQEETTMSRRLAESPHSLPLLSLLTTLSTFLCLAGLAGAQVTPRHSVVHGV
jgi:hypothetical protein